MSLKPLSNKLNKFDKEKFKIPVKDWDNFIGLLGEINCKKMCGNQYIKNTTELFENENSINVFCNWCHQ